MTRTIAVLALLALSACATEPQPQAAADQAKPKGEKQYMLGSKVPVGSAGEMPVTKESADTYRDSRMNQNFLGFPKP
jgi:hypothetical protein